MRQLYTQKLLIGPIEASYKPVSQVHVYYFLVEQGVKNTTLEKFGCASSLFVTGVSCRADGAASVLAGTVGAG